MTDQELFTLSENFLSVSSHSEAREYKSKLYANLRAKGFQEEHLRKWDEAAEHRLSELKKEEEFKKVTSHARMEFYHLLNHPILKGN